MKQGLFDKIWNGVPEGGPKTIERPPIRFLPNHGQAYVPATPPQRPAPREAVELRSGSIEPQPVQHGGLWLSLFLSAFIFVFAYAFFAGNPADASGNDHQVIYLHQSDDQQSGNTSTNDGVPAPSLGHGVRCPDAGAHVSGYLDGVQTDPACLAFFPQMRK